MGASFKSSLDIKYPTFRDYRNVDLWLEGRTVDDGAEGLWRVYDNIYDLTDFIKFHPGGCDWIELTKGTDITEAFEAHHITSTAESILPTYFKKKATTSRNYPFTFHENGFYKTLKRNINKTFPNLRGQSTVRSKVITDTVLACYVAFFLLAVYFRSFLCGLMSGLSLGLTSIAAHNYFHQKNNFRAFYFDLSMLSSREWKISHVLSHHLYPNTISDLEIILLEPFLWYLPKQKNWLVRYGSWIYFGVPCSLLFLVTYLKRFAQVLQLKIKFSWTMLLPLTIPFLSWIVTGESLKFCFIMFLFITAVGSFQLSVVGINAGHHHPDLFHDGDAPRPIAEMDWGIYQLDAVMDRSDITGSHFLVLTNFGDHALHHLFPTLDHQLLDALYPVFLETCKEFGIEWKLNSQLECLKGQFKQLAIVSPKKNPPKQLIKAMS